MVVLAVGLVCVAVGLLGPDAAGHGRDAEGRRAFRDVESHGLLGEPGNGRVDHKAGCRLSKADQCLPNQKCSWWGEPVMVQPIQ
ncbi:MAG: hypothetical protein MZV49_15560 [Rhodopseudomonas palustris]|nr:hypothetical protein [Rhodopseudomonas palustris]